jgi:hypothetical protein
MILFVAIRFGVMNSNKNGFIKQLTFCQMANSFRFCPDTFALFN